MRVALYGTVGQLGTEIQRRAPADVALDAIGQDAADFSDPSAVAAHVANLKADVIINAVAHTAVDKAEDEPELAHKINAASVGALGGAAALAGIPVVHVSTDYVFPGNGDRPWQPTDETGPLGVYGASKLAGEEALRESGARHAILRTSWVFSAHGSNFVKTMLRLGAERDSLSIVSDQIGGPTPAADLADACLTVAASLHAGHPGGTFHISGQPDVSWAEFAQEIFEQSGLSPQIVSVPTSAYPTRATRPLNSRLDCSSLKTEFGIDRPDWRDGLRIVLDELRG